MLRRALALLLLVCAPASAQIPRPHGGGDSGAADSVALAVLQEVSCPLQAVGVKNQWCHSTGSNRIFLCMRDAGCDAANWLLVETTPDELDVILKSGETPQPLRIPAFDGASADTMIISKCSLNGDKNGIVCDPGANPQVLELNEAEPSTGSESVSLEAPSDITTSKRWVADATGHFPSDLVDGARTISSTIFIDATWPSSTIRFVSRMNRDRDVSDARARCSVPTDNLDTKDCSGQVFVYDCISDGTNASDLSDCSVVYRRTGQDEWGADGTPTNFATPPRIQSGHWMGVAVSSGDSPSIWAVTVDLDTVQP